MEDKPINNDNLEQIAGWLLGIKDLEIIKVKKYFKIQCIFKNF